ncbi:MAG: hypothetical protein ACLPVW_19445 [Terriglobales bacterium]
MTQRYLDFAEKLPTFRGGFLRTLQSIRERQIRRADELYARTRAPSGTDVSYSGFRLIELFPAEEYDKLISGLRKLFPTQRYGRDEIDRLGTTVPDLFEGRWSNIGTLCRGRLIGPSQIRIVPDLPKEIVSVGVSAHKILPSAVVLAFEVRMTEAATKELMALHNRKYLPAIRFHRWAPWRKHSWGSSESPAEWGMQDAILGWENGLHSGVERVVRPYLSGFFARSGRGASRLPAIDIFTVTGLPSGDDTEKRLQGTSAWMDSLVLRSRASPLGDYAGKDLMFVWAKESDERPPVPYRFIEIYPQLPADENDRSHRDFLLQENLDAALPYICFLEALSRVRQQLETLRIRVYRALARGSSVWGRLRTEMKLNDRLQEEAMFVSRLALELEDAKPWLEHEAGVLRELTRLVSLGDKKPYNLADALIRSLNFHLDRVRKHLDLVAKIFTDYVSRRNVAVMYGLQLLILVLTVIATVAAGLGVLANWCQIQALVHLVLGH